MKNVLIVGGERIHKYYDTAAYKATVLSSTNVEVADGADLIIVKDFSVETISEFLRENTTRFDAVTSFSEMGTIAANYISGRLNIRTNHCSGSLKTMSKSETRKSLKGLAGHHLPFLFLRKGDCTGTLCEFIDSHGVVVAKPNSGTGSCGVVKTDSVDECLEVLQQHNEIIVEPFLNGVEISLESYTDNGHTRLLAVTRKHKVGFVESGHDITPAWEHPHFELLQSYVDELFRAIGYVNGPGHTEVIFDEKYLSVGLVETHSRAGGDLIWLMTWHATGYNQIDATIKKLLDIPYEPDRKSERYSVRFLFPKASGLVNDVTIPSKGKSCFNMASCLGTPQNVVFPPRSSHDRLAIAWTKTEDLAGLSFSDVEICYG